MSTQVHGPRKYPMVPDLFYIVAVHVQYMDNIHLSIFLTRVVYVILIIMC